MIAHDNERRRLAVMAIMPFTLSGGAAFNGAFNIAATTNEYKAQSGGRKIAKSAYLFPSSNAFGKRPKTLAHF